jgi:small subunit ribosomal protein S17
MADEEKNETTEETPEETVEETPAAEVEETAAEVSDTGVVPDTGSEPEAAVDEEEAPVAEDAPEAEEVPDTATGDAAPAAPAKRQRSQKHVPRSARRTRTKPVREKPATRKPITRTENPESELGRRQERRGVVVSDKGDKTIVVKVDVIKSHPKYKKVIRRTAKFHAHDEANTAGVGDTVRIVETRPLSKTKRWRLAEIVEKAR